MRETADFEYKNVYIYYVHIFFPIIIKKIKSTVNFSFSPPDKTLTFIHTYQRYLFIKMM